ncbi:MAG: hypothetical protein RSB97_03520 [Christensenella sp.]
MTPRKIGEAEEKAKDTRRERKSGGRKKWIIITAAVIAAAAVVFIIWNPFKLSMSFAPPTPTYPTMPPDVEPTPTITSAVAPTVAPTAGGSAVPTQEIVTAGADVFKNSYDHIGETVKLEGKVIKDSENNQGLMTIYVQAEAEQYAFVTMLDEQKEHTYKAGDTVSVVGIVSAETEIKDEHDLSHKGPLIAAMEVKLSS